MEHVTSADGTTIVYQQSGTGQPLILVDGALCHRTFGPMGALAPFLADQFTVTIYDRRGRGDSGDTAPYAVEREIDDLSALIRQAGGSAFVYGISSGAALAVAAASRLPSIQKLAVYEPPFMLTEVDRQQAAAYTQDLTELLAEGRRGDAVARFMTRVGMPDEAVSGMRQAPMWPGLEAVAPTLAYDDAVLGDSSVPTARAASIRIPTLVMDGSASPPFMRDAARALADAIPSAVYRTLEGQTHEVSPEALAPALKAFFRA
ncbi:MAG: alpha/beta hydrolase [Anaerolineae bacterium]|nr:alpha/beta hydrolase [Anaerolineae bacterium]